MNPSDEISKFLNGGPKVSELAPQTLCEELPSARERASALLAANDGILVVTDQERSEKSRRLDIPFEELHVTDFIIIGGLYTLRRAKQIYYRANDGRIRIFKDVNRQITR